MKKMITLILVFVIAVLSSGCMDSGTMSKYDIYIQLYDNDVEEYNPVINELIEKQENYTAAYEANINTSDKDTKENELDEALDQLITAENNYRSAANNIYRHLNEFESFVISNEDTLERKGVDTVQLKVDIQDWKEEIRYNLNQFQLNL
ncbi:hypothetical protein [Methanococcoides alaskense]|uniref:Small nuclear ribonucleoprotein (SnRNP)-like protein n=1 Tax=Methanococcoides alaskense TaxID=325778 RepID=A0AA90TZQ4_9EURY|nr:hypothetical protein [Methanococcoides alaskense]MDA0524740.1 hypothetical protein [Methanococcoides alaskense]MDR6223140.1 small nuclear ribonucleoprotein (snRNP)-like protein [Methanococcoides alaskense]